jgi:hypothetical protein
MTNEEMINILGRSTLAMIENEKKSNPLGYQHEFLGKMTKISSNFFIFLRKDEHFGHQEKIRPHFITIGIDKGTWNATVCVASIWQYELNNLKVEFGYKC